MSNTVVVDGFEWDADKAASNLSKHGVSFEEAISVLVSDASVSAPDFNHLGRVNTIGFSTTARVLFVVTTEVVDGNTRIISARKANKAEAKRLGE